ncbi:MAG: hypothetical protein ACOX7L_06775 [Dethiobacteria bacterium]
MKDISFRWPIMVLVMLLTFGIVLGFNFWHQQRVKAPLVEKLQQLEGVRGIEVSTLEKSKKLRFVVALGVTNNMPDTYRKMDELLLSACNEDGYQLILSDKKSPYLEQVYDKIQFALMEGERTGNYTVMKEEIDRLIEQEKTELDYRLWVDQERIYLFISSGPHYLYKVIPVRTIDQVG